MIKNRCIVAEINGSKDYTHAYHTVCVCMYASIKDMTENLTV